jgi:hypothetical protein
MNCGLPFKIQSPSAKRRAGFAPSRASVLLAVFACYGLDGAARRPVSPASFALAFQRLRFSASSRKTLPSEAIFEVSDVEGAICAPKP